MGYTTHFEGSIAVSPPLNTKEVEYLNAFSASRRMLRKEGPYYVKGDGEEDFFNKSSTSTILNYNEPPEGQPGLWCQWIASEDGGSIEWDGGEKFYEAPVWMSYLLHHFLKSDPIAKLLEPQLFDFLQGHQLEGRIYAVGEESSDLWCLEVKEGQVYHRALNTQSGGLQGYIKSYQREQEKKGIVRDISVRLKAAKDLSSNDFFKELNQIELERVRPYIDFMKSDKAKWHKKTLVEMPLSVEQKMQIESIKMSDELIKALKNKGKQSQMRKGL